LVVGCGFPYCNARAKPDFFSQVFDRKAFAAKDDFTRRARM
jgi:hypothetical protein